MSGDSPALPDELIDQILRGQPIDMKAPREAHLLAEWVEALRRPARPNELRGAPLAVAAFRWAKSPSGRPVSRPRRLRIPMRVVIAGAAVLGALSAGVAVAAANGSLPAPLQVVAHVLFGAPAPSAANAGGHRPAGSTGVIELPAEFHPLVPSQPPPVGTSTPSAPSDPPSSQPDASPGTSVLAPTSTDTNSMASQPETKPADTPQLESPGGPHADVEPKAAHPAQPESPGGRPADVEPKAAHPAQPESPGAPADVGEVVISPAPAVDLEQDPTGMGKPPPGQE
jgi:hypothetical protein